MRRYLLARGFSLLVMNMFWSASAHNYVPPEDMVPPPELCSIPYIPVSFFDYLPSSFLTTVTHSHPKTEENNSEAPLLCTASFTVTYKAEDIIKWIKENTPDSAFGAWAREYAVRRKLAPQDVLAAYIAEIIQTVPLSSYWGLSARALFVHENLGTVDEQQRFLRDLITQNKADSDFGAWARNKAAVLGFHTMDTFQEALNDLLEVYHAQPVSTPHGAWARIMLIDHLPNNPMLLTPAEITTILEELKKTYAPSSLWHTLATALEESLQKTMWHHCPKKRKRSDIDHTTI